ncbi:acyl-coenzyme A diphosphatase NUDT19 [Phodopus roborovskii]|uniref:Acyl-coenzyme A diphosphatase NUDT19 n=1 Tax=Phodopus roborovskii TaxID=109678 RepID=A0AAV0A743_PHORO|nr:acyl-coenzyme A diphosphatase NUDT19 [Phodopus roborovskii]CAH7358755.1 Nudt19 [Phodopus roborovskii]
MSGPLRSGPSTWRRAATVVLAAGCSRPGPAGPRSSDGFRLLLLQRAPNQRFMPGAHVFPGGTLDAADSSADWLRLFAPRHTPPRFGLGREPPQQPPFPGLPRDDAAAGALPDDVALRICALREAFEEAGLLLLRPRGSEPASQQPGLALPLPPPPGLAAWRSRVRTDPHCFLQLCALLDCTPDIWALRSWGGWLTPYPHLSRRFNTTFFLCCLRQTPPVEPDHIELVDYKWLSPAEATECFLSKEIWLAPPQFYEIRRLETFASLSALYRFSSDCPLEITEKWLPIILLTADGTISLLPGDELYRKDSHFLENPMSTDKKTEEILKEGKVVNRMVIHGFLLYEIYVSLLSNNKRVYPKSYVVQKNPPAHL